jgi:hypothetical protein
MNLKRRRLLIWLLVLMGAVVDVVVLAWHTTLFAQHSTIKSTSPDARYVAAGIEMTTFSLIAEIAIQPNKRAE